MINNIVKSFFFKTWRKYFHHLKTWKFKIESRNIGNYWKTTNISCFFLEEEIIKTHSFLWFKPFFFTFGRKTQKFFVYFYCKNIQIVEKCKKTIKIRKIKIMFNSFAPQLSTVPMFTGFEALDTKWKMVLKSDDFYLKSKSFHPKKLETTKNKENLSLSNILNWIIINLHSWEEIREICVGFLISIGASFGGGAKFFKVESIFRFRFTTTLFVESIEVLLSVWSDLCSTSSADKFGNFFPVPSIDFEPWITRKVPSRKSSCSALDHLPTEELPSCSWSFDIWLLTSFKYL